METGLKIKDFREKVLSIKNNITDEEFFVSSSAKAYIQNLAEAVCKAYNSNITLHLKWEDNDKLAYATDRFLLYININNEYFHRCNNRIEKLVMTKALALHECGHLLFTDFHLINSSIKVFSENRKLFPEPKCSEYTDFLTDFAVMDYEEIAEWIQIYQEMSNAIEDGFIEYMVMKTLPGEGKCLLPLRKMQLDQFDNVKVQKTQGIPNSSILFNCILSLAKYGTVKMDKDDKDEPYIKRLLECYDVIKKATITQKSYERVKLLNEIFCKLYKFMKEEKEEQEKEENQSNEGGSNSADKQNNKQKSPEQTQSNDSSNGSDSSQNNDNKEFNIEDKNGSENSSDGSNVTQNLNNEELSENDEKPQNEANTSSNESTSRPSAKNLINNIPQQPKEDVNTGCGSVLNDNNINQEDTSISRNNDDRMENMINNKPDDTENGESSSDRYMSEQISEDIASEKLNGELEKDLAETLKKECEKFDFSPINNNYKISIHRNEPSKHALEIYEQDMQEINFLVKKTVDEIKNKIKDRQNGGKINGLYMGRYLDQHSLSRFDLRMLCKNDLPEDIPNMAICVYIDCSGSMSTQNKLVNARRTALLLYHFGLKLNIPVMVYSHNAYGVVNMYDLADFNSVDGKDKYRICDLTAKGNNRDGMALRFCSEKLSQRSEETKLMFVISDGLPSAYASYLDAEQDIRNVLVDYAKKNVKYITVGLGSYKEKIEQLYTQDLSPKVAARFLSIDNSDELPITIVRTIKNIIK